MVALLQKLPVIEHTTQNNSCQSIVATPSNPEFLVHNSKLSIARIMLQLLLVGRKPLLESWSKFGTTAIAIELHACNQPAIYIYIYICMHITRSIDHNNNKRNNFLEWGVRNFPLAHIFFNYFLKSLNHFFLFLFLFESIACTVLCILSLSLSHNSDVRNHKTSVRKILFRSYLHLIWFLSIYTNNEYPYNIHLESLNPQFYKYLIQTWDN